MSNQQLTPRVTAVGSSVGRATGFDLALPRQSNPANLDAAIERNRSFAAAGGHHGAVVFPTCACSCSRASIPAPTPRTSSVSS
jgi:hypothetical protein